MKDFLKYMLAAIVGVCIVGVVFTIIGIMSIAGHYRHHEHCRNGRFFIGKRNESKR